MSEWSDLTESATFSGQTKTARLFQSSLWGFFPSKIWKFQGFKDSSSINNVYWHGCDIFFLCPLSDIWLCCFLFHWQSFWMKPPLKLVLRPRWNEGVSFIPEHSTQICSSKNNLLVAHFNPLCHQLLEGLFLWSTEVPTKTDVREIYGLSKGSMFHCFDFH